MDGKSSDATGSYLVKVTCSEAVLNNSSKHPYLFLDGIGTSFTSTDTNHLL